MTRKEILERLGQVVEESSAEEVDWESVTEETTLESFGFDSLAVLDLIFDLEQDFGVTVAAKDILEMKTTGELISFLETRLP